MIRRPHALAIALLFGASLLGTTPSQAQMLHVQVEGAVAHPGEQTLPPDARRAQAVIAAQPTSEAYAVGAALLRQDNIVPQTRLKAGLLYDLKALAQYEKSPLAEAALALHDWLEAQPVTGREPALPLDPRRLELDLDASQRLAEGDRFVYPIRPTTVRVIGAVERACTLPHMPLQDALRYLRDCRISAAADRDTLFVIQPDGVVQALGVAAWNRSDAQAVAPGAVLFVPLAQRRVAKVDPDFNAQFATFVATQLLPTQDVTP